jgi:predicted small secreted protein
MASKAMTAIAIVCALALAACNTVRGAAADSAANCTENAINGGYCK